MTETTIYTKYLGTFSRFSTVFLQHKLNRTRLLLGESERTNRSKDECPASYSKWKSWQTSSKIFNRKNFLTSICQLSNFYFFQDYYYSKLAHFENDIRLFSWYFIIIRSDVMQF